MQIGLILVGGFVFAALGLWWIVLWVNGARTPPSDNEGGDNTISE